MSDKRVYFAGFGALGGAASGLLYDAFFAVSSIDTESSGGALSTWVVAGALDGMAITALLAFGQRRYLRQLFDKRQVSKAAGLSAAGGALGGLVASWLGFPLAALFGGAVHAGRFIGWVILGGVIGFVVSKVVPNLRARVASAAGAAGGLAGCALMYLVHSFVLGIATGGAAIGAAIALAEAALRDAWLEISYGAGEINTVSLGAEPVSVGSGAECTVYAGDVSPLACRFRLENGVVLFEHVSGGGSPRPVRQGEIIKVGRLTLRVHEAKTVKTRAQGD